MPEILSLECFVAGKTPGAAEQCFPSCPLPPTNVRLLCLGWINQLAISSPSKVSPFRKSNRDKGLLVLASEINRPTREQGPSPQARWDFPALQTVLKPWEAAGKRLGQTGGAWVRDALGAGWCFSSARLLGYPEVWAAGQQDALSDGEVQTIPVLPPNQGAAGSASTRSAHLPPGPGSARPPRQHLITCYSIILIRGVSR